MIVYKKIRMLKNLFWKSKKGDSFHNIFLMKYGFTDFFLLINKKKTFYFKSKNKVKQKNYYSVFFCCH